jgi:hypothetical protein
MVGALASSSMAILQIDVPATDFPEGHGPEASNLYFLNTATMQPFPTPWPTTMIAGPDGFPLAYHLIFNYDGNPNLPIPAAVHHVDLMAGSCMNTWTPAMFAVLYAAGPNFPVNGVFGPFGDDCWGPACEPGCTALPATLEFGEVTDNAPVSQIFTICNTSVGDCPPITGSITENCDAMIVAPVDYSLMTGECLDITVTFAPDVAGEFTCEIITGCGSVVAHGIYTPVVGADDQPAIFALGEAFPNPFNPTTTISYSVPETQAATLSVFNTNGQLVQTLVSGMVERGEHKVVFDAASLSSGVYVYTLQTANQTEMKKMVLVK